MSIESLKKQARRHEQDEQWQKALDQYQKAIRALAEDEQTDIGLINRVGDLFVRVGKLDDAVENYEQAVDLYREAFLPNNAIAVCKKIIRNVPDRHQAYLKIGQIRAEQGFLPDARTNFLTYAERMQQAGDLDESFRALVEFCDLAPDEVDVRITVADQMAANQRTEDAVEQLLVAYGRLTQSGEADLASGVEAKIKELDPSADLSAAPSPIPVDDGFDTGFGELDLGTPAEIGSEAAVADTGDFDLGDSDDLTTSLEDAAAEVAAEVSGGLEHEDEEEQGVELPMMGFDDDEAEGEEEAAALPMIGFDDDEAEGEEEAAALPTMGFDDDGNESEEEAPELPTMSFDDEEDEGEEDAAALPTMEISDAPAEPTPSDPEVGAATEEAERLPEMDAGFTDLSTEAAETLEEALEEAVPEAPSPVEEPAAPADAASGGDDFVDFGAMILGDRSDEQKSTRFKVAYEEPSGDEEADFAKMLTQFKEKVSENLDSGDVRAHYDLGTAYKEMGLLEEAISSFQQALRASSDHLPTYELMGQTFIEMGQPDAAVRTLRRALDVGSSVEDEFVGIYYYLARAFEELDNKSSAVEYYDRVFSLDINFADVTERLRELR